MLSGGRQLICRYSITRSEDSPIADTLRSEDVMKRIMNKMFLPLIALVLFAVVAVEAQDTCDNGVKIDSSTSGAVFSDASTMPRSVSAELKKATLSSDSEVPGPQRVSRSLDEEDEQTLNEDESGELLSREDRAVHWTCPYKAKYLWGFPIGDYVCYLIRPRPLKIAVCMTKCCKSPFPTLPNRPCVPVYYPRFVKVVCKHECCNGWITKWKKIWVPLKCKCIWCHQF